jgi:hypothetical protein
MWRESALSAAFFSGPAVRVPWLGRDQVKRMKKAKPVAVPDDNVVDLGAERERRAAAEPEPMAQATDTPLEASVPKGGSTEAQAALPMSEAANPPAPQATPEESAQASPALRAQATRRKRKPKARAMPQRR